MIQVRRALVLLLLPPALLAACARGGGYEKPLVAVSVAPVESRRQGGGSRFSASIEPYAHVNLAFRVGGYVDAIHQVRGADGRSRDVQEGDRVAKGTILARIRESDYRARAAQAQSAVAQARAALEKARQDNERAQALFGTASLTRPELDAATAQFDSARAQLEGAEAALREAELALEDCTIEAPMDSLLLNRDIERGELAAAGTVAFLLADTTSVEAVFGVPDTMVGGVRLGDALSIETEAFRGETFPGQVTRIAPSADPKSRVFDVEVTIANRDNRLRVGMIASLAVAEKGAAGAVPVVPLTSIVRPKGDPSGYAVLIVEDEGGRSIARERVVSLGEAFGSLIAVGSGVAEGDRVIVKGASLVADGDPVRVVP